MISISPFLVNWDQPTKLILKLIFRTENLKRYYIMAESVDCHSKGRVRLGANENDAAILEKHAKNFTGRLLDFVSPLIEKHDTDEILLTGGGSGIGVISKLIKKSFEAYSIKVFNDQEGVDPDEENSVYKWDDSHGLDRVATAIGGSSIIMEKNAPSVITPAPALPRIIGSSQQIFTECRCGGLNTDCAFCGGSGSYSGLVGRGR